MDSDELEIEELTMHKTCVHLCVHFADWLKTIVQHGGLKEAQISLLFLVFAGVTATFGAKTCNIANFGAITPIMALKRQNLHSSFLETVVGVVFQ